MISGTISITEGRTARNAGIRAEAVGGRSKYTTCAPIEKG